VSCCHTVRLQGYSVNVDSSSDHFGEKYLRPRTETSYSEKHGHWALSQHMT